nr:MAG TPA: hypothetical protein [Caudoviricetes sp.]
MDLAVVRQTRASLTLRSNVWLRGVWGLPI